MNVKVFYLLLYSIAIRTILRSLQDIHLLFQWVVLLLISLLRWDQIPWWYSQGRGDTYTPGTARPYRVQPWSKDTIQCTYTQEGSSFVVWGHWPLWQDEKHPMKNRKKQEGLLIYSSVFTKPSLHYRHIRRLHSPLHRIVSNRQSHSL